MKLFKLLLSLTIVLAVISIIQAGKNLHKNKNTVTEPDVLGDSSNWTKKRNSAIAYGFADTGAYDVPQDELSKLKSPTMIPKLPDKFDLPPKGPLENVEEVASNTDYYDGSTNLNKKKMTCRIYGNASDCLKNSSCGWCGSNNTCIMGNNLGPLQSCLKSTFLYSSPIPNFEKRATVTSNGQNALKFSLIDK